MFPGLVQSCGKTRRKYECVGGTNVFNLVVKEAEGGRREEKQKKGGMSVELKQCEKMRNQRVIFKTILSYPPPFNDLDATSRLLKLDQLFLTTPPPSYPPFVGWKLFLKDISTHENLIIGSPDIQRVLINIHFRRHI